MRSDRDDGSPSTVSGAIGTQVLDRTCRYGTRTLAGVLLGASLLTGLPADRADAAEVIPEVRLLTWTKAQYPIQYEIAIVLAESWGELGLEVEVDPVNFPNPLVERVFVKHDFDAAVINFTAQLQRLDPEFYTFNTFHTSRAEAGGWNFSGVQNPELDKLLEAQRQTYDIDERVQLVNQIQNWLYEQNPWLPLVNPDELQAYNGANFSDPVLPKISGFNDAVAFFTLKPTGERTIVRWAAPFSDLKTTSPVLASESSQVRIIYLMYDTLMKIGPNGEPQQWMITEITPVDDTTIEVTLRDDLMFHDGERLTAEDVAFTFNYMKEKKAAYYTSTLGQLVSAEAIGEDKVRFTLEAAYAPFITQTLAMVPIIPKHIWESVEDPTTFDSIPPIGSGPYKFDHWNQAQEFAVTRFDDHFEPTENEGVLVIFYGTAEAGYTAFTRQEADVVDSVLPHQLPELENMDFVRNVAVPSNGSDTVVFNLRNTPYDDPQFRLALSYATPRQRMLMEFYDGNGAVAGSVIAPANEFWHDASVEPYPYDMEKARQILEDAGYSWSSEGRLQFPE